MNHNETNTTTSPSPNRGGENVQERNDAMREFGQLLLDGYFRFRSPLAAEGYLQEYKTTLDIVDDLAPMMTIDAETVAVYMMSHDYRPTTEADGTVKWAVYRQLLPDSCID